ncbi:MAG TPA: PilZ domain-containing protein [Polyangiaceae bacterium]
MQASPNSAAPYLLAHPHELARRRSPRVTVEAAVSYARGRQRGLGRTLNLGLGGMAIESEEPPAVGETTLLVVRLPDTQPLPFTGVVRWSRPGCFGIQYGPLGGPQTRVLVQLLARGNAFR